MKNLALCLVFLLSACSSLYDAPANPLDCGRQFINAIFNGNFKRAKQLMLKDPQNLRLLEVQIAEDFHSRNSLDKDQLRTASIVINEVEHVSDSVTIINFLNSYDNKPAVLKVINKEGEWLVDLKYTFSGNF